jgi:hypothetical protein
VNVWAEKTLFANRREVRTADIHDLLILAHRAIDRYFEQGEAAAPIRRAK